MTEPETGCGADVAAYALGALSEEDSRRFEAHLETCEMCRADLEGLRPVVTALPAAAEPVSPPPELRDRIMRVVEGEARDAQRERKRGERKHRRGFLSLRPLPALAAACTLILVGAVLGIAALSGGDGQTYEGEFLRASGSVELRVEDGDGTLRIRDMDPPPPRRVYQVWTQRIGENPRPTDALFTVDQDGSASVDVPGDLDAVDQVLVTDEPPNGSEEPTTAPYFAVRLSS